MPLRLRNSRGNVALLLALTIGALFAVGGFAIDTTLFLLKRQEVQALAEDVALAAALSLPDRESAEAAATAWFDILRFDGSRQIAETEDVEVVVSDNSGSTSAAVPYSVSSITVTVSVVFTPEVFPIGDLSPEAFTITGSATARLKPTDVLLIVDNSASFYQAGSLAGDGIDTSSYFKNWGGGEVLAETCYGSPWRQFKAGVLRLYDSLSELSSHRIAVMLATSRAAQPFLLADFGETALTGAQLESQADDDTAASTRCAVMTPDDGFPVPEPVVAGSYWAARTNLYGLLSDPDNDDYSISSSTALATREALWMLSAGYPTRSGYLSPDSYYLPDAGTVLAPAAAHLKDSRRSDGVPVHRRVLVFVTDDSGAVWQSDGKPISSGVRAFCENQEDYADMSGIDFINVYYGHNDDLPYHQYDDTDVSTMRTECYSSEAKGGKTLVEYSVKSGSWSADDFAEKVMPLVSLGLKEAELVR